MVKSATIPEPELNFDEQSSPESEEVFDDIYEHSSSIESVDLDAEEFKSFKRSSSDLAGFKKTTEEDEDDRRGGMNWQEMFLQEKMMGDPQSIPQSIIYELINETINKEAVNISCPESAQGMFSYIFLIPLTHLQYITIPSPLSKRNDNYYPITLLMSTLWIFAYAYIIVWFTYDLTTALDWKFSYIPMFLYPLGVSVRDVKKFRDFELALEVFNKELPDQEISLAESYSPQIF